MKKAILFAMLLYVGSAVNISHAFECDSWPYEGIPFLRVKTDTISLHQNPSSKSPLNQPVKIEKSSIVSFSNGVTELIRKRKEYGASSLVKATDVINTKIILDKSLQKVVVPGAIKAAWPGSFTVINHYGPIKSCEEIGKVKFKSLSEFNFKEGDIIENLIYLGEGQCMMRFKGQVFVHETCLDNVDGLEVQSQPQTEWWLSLIESKKELGWFNMTEKNGILELIDTVK
jgi:hypothetical protein